MTDPTERRDPPPSRPRPATATTRARDDALVTHRRLDAPAPRGHVLLMQGRGDFLDKYDDAARRLADLGLTTVWWDWRGQGDSEQLGAPPGAGHVNRFEDYLLDLDAVTAANPDLPGPRVLVAHSMGGLIAMMHLLRRRSDAAAVVLLAPMLAFNGAPPLSVLRTLAGARRLIGHSRRFAAGERWTPPEACTLETNMATDDNDAFARLQQLRLPPRHGLVTGSTWGWTSAAAAAMTRVQHADLSGITAAVLIASIATDPSVDARAHHDLARRLPRAQLREHTGRHDLLWGSADHVDALWRDIERHLTFTLTAWRQPQP